MQRGVRACGGGQHLQALLAEPDKERRLAVLLEHRQDLLQDCEAVLQETGRGEYAELAGFLGAAVAAFRAGHRAAAQVLAVNTLDTLLCKANPDLLVNKTQFYKKLIEQVEEEPDGRLVVWAITHRPVVSALNTFWPGDKVPTEINRHASAHGVGAVQYT
ncbi:hypothetical protein GCM10010428_44530 [Actinosynnema pretiosum subsp. pretiosum]